MKREGIPHGTLEMIEYDSKTVGTTRKMQVYTPPGYTTDEKYPVLYLLNGIGGDKRSGNGLRRRTSCSTTSSPTARPCR